MNAFNLYRILGSQKPVQVFRCLIQAVVATVVIAISCIFPNVYAQFININLEIPAITSFTKSAPLSLRLQPDPFTGQQTLTGTVPINLSASENLHLQVMVQATDSLKNEQGHSLPLRVNFAYRNDGNHELPASGWNVSGKFVGFPMSNTGLLIGNMRGPPALLQAWLFISVSAGLPQYINTTYVGSIYVNIEFN